MVLSYLLPLRLYQFDADGSSGGTCLVMNLSSLRGISRPRWLVLIRRRLSKMLLMFCLLIVSPLGCATTLAQQYQQLLSQANLLSAMALLHFDPDPRPRGFYEEQGLEALNEASLRLKAQAISIGLSGPSLDGIVESLNALQRLPPQQVVSYAPTLLVQLLDHHERFNERVTMLYQAQSVSPLVQAMNQQSQRIAAIRLHALARNARVLGRHTIALENTFTQLDSEIEQGFAGLASALPKPETAQLQRQQKVYRFVRMKLLTPDALRNSAAAEHYINRLISWFDEHAAKADS